MNRSNSCVSLIPLSPIYHQETVPVFETMNPGDSSLLRSILYENYIEVLNELRENLNIIYCMDVKDKENLPSDILVDFNDILWIDTSAINFEIKNLNDKRIKNFHNNLIVFSHSIGVSSRDIRKMFSLLEMEDESILIGRYNDERIASLGYNTYNEELMNNISEERNYYNEMLMKASKYENFVHTLNSFMIIDTKDDFKKLYTELSKKESLNYCSQKMHEKFTHLFIEYKDLLK